VQARRTSKWTHLQLAKLRAVHAVHRFAQPCTNGNHTHPSTKLDLHDQSARQPLAKTKRGLSCQSYFWTSRGSPVRQMLTYSFLNTSIGGFVAFDILITQLSARK